MHATPWNWEQIGTKLRTKYAIYQKLANLHRKKISMLSDLKVSSLTCKCVFYRPEHNSKGGTIDLNFESLEIQKYTNG